MEKKRCPFDKKKCIGDECTLWRVEEFTNTLTGEKKVGAGCQLWLQYELTRENVVETIRVGAEVHHLLNQIYAIALTPPGQKPPALSGNLERDLQVIKMLKGEKDVEDNRD